MAVLQDVVDTEARKPVLHADTLKLTKRRRREKQNTYKEKKQGDVFVLRRNRVKPPSADGNQ